MIIFVGPPGAGKSIQSQLLAKHLGCKYLSIGQLLRANANSYQLEKMKQGELVNDKEVIVGLDDFISKLGPQEQFILDGFPRSLAQVRWLLQKCRGRIDAVIHLLVSKPVINERLSKRGRPDDTPAVIEQRHREYAQTTLQIISQFKESGIVVYELAGEKPIEAVARAILKVIVQND